MVKQQIPYFASAEAIGTPLSKGEVPSTGVVTLYQCNAEYEPNYDVHTDCMLAYVYGINNGGALDSWVKHKHTYGDKTVIGLMVAINRDSGEYIEEYAGERGFMDVQTRADGSFRRHSVMGPHNIYYMVPTAPYVEYKWKVLQHFLDTGFVKIVTFEEPEFWNDTGYSEGFKEEWKRFYGIPFEKPESSALARYRSQYLKAYLFYNAVRILSLRVKETYPGVQVLLPTHSIDDYCAHGIATNLSMFASIDEVDGFIGQTWSDGVVRKLPFAGEECSNPFATAVTQYRSYRPFLNRGQPLYLLQDPASDNGEITQEEKEERWKQTVVASMMQNDTTLSQFTIWPQRAFSAASPDYRTIQLNVYKMYYEMDKLRGTLYAGSAGIGLGLSDTASWSIGDEHYPTGKSLATIFGVSMQLIEDCILPEVVALDSLSDVKQLSHIRMLLVAYDVMKPLTQQVNEVLAKWVKQGGRLLVVSGDDGYTHMKDTWWNQLGTTPLKDLLSHLEINVTVSPVALNDTIPFFKGEQLPKECRITGEYAQRAFSFEGDRIQPFLTAQEKTIGFTAKAGEGIIGALGLFSSYFSLSRPNEDLLRDLWKMMLQEEYISADSIAAVRGNYVALWGSDTLELAKDKVFLDLFSSVLRPVKGGVIKKGLTAFYYDVTHQLQQNKPALLFTGGVEVAPRVETDRSVQFTITHPSDSKSASMIFNGGRRLTSVSAVTESGCVVELETMSYPEFDMELLVYHCNDVSDPLTVSVQWNEQ